MNRTIENNSIAFVGDLTVDTYPKAGKIHLGGASLNGAIWALRSGARRVSVFAAVGTDEAGVQFQRKMEAEGINIEGVVVKPGNTSSIMIILQPNGDHTWGDWDAGVLGDYHLRKSDYIRLQTYTAVSLTVYGKTRHLLSEFARPWRQGKATPFLAVNFDDLSQFERSTAQVAESIQGIDAGFFGLNPENDTAILSDLQRLAQETRKLIVVTLGKEGAIAWKGNDEYRSPAIYVAKVADTTGAGDAFLAGFLVEYLRSQSINGSLDAGNMVASQKIQKLGAY
jgi:fructoselysine 6-kinase